MSSQTKAKQQTDKHSEAIDYIQAEIHLAREEFSELQTKIIAAKEELRDAENQTKSAQLKLVQAENKLHQENAKLDQVDKAYKSKGTVLNELKKLIESTESEYRNDIRAYDDQIATLKASQKILESDIKKRTNYQKEQEAQIAAAIEVGNDRILDLNYEVSELEKRGTALEIKISDANERFPIVQQKVIEEEAKLRDLNANYEVVNNTYQNTLKGVRSRIEEETEKYKETVAKGNKIVQRLKVKEDELVLREASLDKRAEELADGFKRLETRKRLYGNP